MSSPKQFQCASIKQGRHGSRRWPGWWRGV
jgi:hypothetical protein